jgi:SH3 domain
VLIKSAFYILDDHAKGFHATWTCSFFTSTDKFHPHMVNTPKAKGPKGPPRLSVDTTGLSTRFSGDAQKKAINPQTGQVIAQPAAATGTHSRLAASQDEESPLLMPIVSESQIDYNLVYALQAYEASLEGQVTVTKGEALQLMDDSNSYWWLVKSTNTQKVTMNLNSFTGISFIRARLVTCQRTILK